ncbi:hypothetical protein B0H11DRAFT_1899054, partial [Mycena galericulata]
MPEMPEWAMSKADNWSKIRVMKTLYLSIWFKNPSHSSTKANSEVGSVRVTARWRPSNIVAPSRVVCFKVWVTPCLEVRLAALVDFGSQPQFLSKLQAPVLLCYTQGLKFPAIGSNPDATVDPDAVRTRTALGIDYVIRRGLGTHRHMLRNEILMKDEGEMNIIRIWVKEDRGASSDERVGGICAREWTAAGNTTNRASELKSSSVGLGVSDTKRMACKKSTSRSILAVGRERN